MNKEIGTRGPFGASRTAALQNVKKSDTARGKETVSTCGDQERRRDLNADAIKHRLNQLKDVYTARMTAHDRNSFAQAEALVDGQLFADLSRLDPQALHEFFEGHADIERHVLMLRELRNLANVVRRDQENLGRPWSPPQSGRALVTVDTSHPTHGRSLEMYNAYRQVYDWLSGQCRDVPSAESLNRLLPPRENWDKPSQRRDEMPVIAQFVGNKALAFYRELKLQPGAEARRRLLACTARPEVWGAYDQDGHPDAYPTAMLLQRAHLRVAMWRTYAAIAADAKLPPMAMEHIGASANYWERVAAWLDRNGDKLVKRIESAAGKSGRVDAAIFDFTGDADYPRAAGKLGKGESEAAEKAALLALLNECGESVSSGADTQDLRTVVELFGTTGAKGHFRFTAAGSRGVWPQAEGGGESVNPKAERDLQLRCAEILALRGDVDTVIIAECETRNHVFNTVETLRSQGVPVWLDDAAHHAGDSIVVMPLIETGGLAEEIGKGLRAVLGDPAGRTGKRTDVFVMLAGSDLVNREGKTGQLRATLEIVTLLLRLLKEYPGVKVRLMEGVGGSNLRTGGADAVRALRDALRFMDDGAFSEAAITVQGIDGHTRYGTPESAQADLRNTAERPLAANGDPARLEKMLLFLEELDRHVGLHDDGSMRNSEGYQALFAPGNPVISGLMNNRRDGSRAPRSGSGHKGIGPDGERTISYVKMKRAVGGLLWHHDWRAVPLEMLNRIRDAWRDPGDDLHALAKVLVADMAVEMTRVDIELAEQVFDHEGGLQGEGNRHKAAAFGALCDAHRHLLAYLRDELHVFEADSAEGLIVPREDDDHNRVVMEALKGELGLANDCGRPEVLDALRARRGEVRVQVKLREADIAMRKKAPSQSSPLQYGKADVLQTAFQRINSHDGPGASDFSPEWLQGQGLPLYPLKEDGAARPRHGRSGLSSDGTVHLSDDGRKILGAGGLKRHEEFHVESGKVKEAFRRAFGARYADHADAADQRRSAVEDSLKALENWLSSTGSRDDAYVTARAREELRIAREQRNLGAAKLRELDALEPQVSGPDQRLALQAERTRQHEKVILAELTRDVIEHCSRPDARPDARWGAEEIGAASARLSNEGRFLLSDISGGLLGIVSHRQTGKTTEDTRAWLSAMPPRDFDLLRRCLPECAEGFTRLQIASAESAKARAELLAGHSEVDALRPIHRRMLSAGER